jgi:hypothetical protein
MTERRTAEEAIGHRANAAPADGLPRPDRDSGNVSMTPLPPGSPSQWHTLRHDLDSTNLLVDAKLGEPTPKAGRCGASLPRRCSRSPAPIT